MSRARAPPNKRSSSCSMDPQPGDVWLAQLGLAAKTRPVVICLPPRPLVLYVLLTTQRRDRPYGAPLPRLPFLDRESVANVQGFGSPLTARLERRTGRLSNDVMVRLKEALVFGFDLQKRSEWLASGLSVRRPPNVRSVGWAWCGNSTTDDQFPRLKAGRKSRGLPVCRWGLGEGVGGDDGEGANLGERRACVRSVAGRGSRARRLRRGGGWDQEGWLFAGRMVASRCFEGSIRVSSLSVPGSEVHYRSRWR